MSTITDITVSKIYVLNVAPKTRVLDRFWYDTTNKILKKCVSIDQSKADAECWEPIGIDPSAIKVTVENGQGNSTTLDLQTYVSAVAEGLIEISGQVTNLNNTKADKTALDTKQDKLNYYNEGDNVANITSETTNTNNVVAKNITLRGVNTSTYNPDTEEDILFHAGSRAKINLETEETSQENCIFGSLVDKELSEESLETHIPTSSAVVSYVDNQTTTIKEDIVNIQQTKSNRGELYFNKGTLICKNKKWATDSAFSYVFTFAMSQDDWTNMSGIYYGHWVNTAAYASNERGVWFGDVGDRLAVRLAYKKSDGTFGSKDIVTSTAQWSPYLDNKPHTICASFSNGIFKLNIDGIQIKSVSVPDFTPSENSQYFTIRSYGKISRIAVYNFDMSDANATYTITDYISGKDESSLLQTTQPVIDWHNLSENKQSTTQTKGQSGTLELNRTDAGSYPRIFENGTFKVGYTYYIRLSGKVLFPSGQTGVSLRLKLPTRTAEITNNLTGEVSVSTPSYSQYVFGQGNGGEFDTTIKFIPTETNTDSNSLFYFNQIATDSNSYVNVSVRCDSALLSLEDYSIEDKVLDISGNDNHATITGLVYGSKTSSVETFVNTVIGDVHEIVDDLRDEVNLLSQQITISTHTSTFTSSSTDITNIYTDDTKAALPGRIMIQPKLSNVAPMYFGENVSDKAKAFPLYPDQITDFYFEDINNFKVASDAVGDGCNFVIEWGVTNVVADIASAFTMYDDNGNKFKIKIANGGLVAEQLN